MYGDFSRNTFDATKHFMRVLMQQGRVQLDADWNEQAAILLHYLQSLAVDLIGQHGGPAGSNFGFGISLDSARNNFIIGNGHYYVDGILCENESKRDAAGNLIPVKYYAQPDYPLEAARHPLPTPPFLVYLDVWERHLTMLEEPYIREKALGGPDTANRTKVLRQVKTTDKLPNGSDILPTFNKAALNTNWPLWLEKWQPHNRGLLKAQGRQPQTNDENKTPCIISPEARFRGAENQLYRVEIHSDGYAEGASGSPKATFKWSRENGSVVYPIVDLNITNDGTVTTTIVTLEHLGRDSRFAPSEGDWVEILDDDYVLQVGIGSTRAVEKLFMIIKIDPINRQVILEGKPSSTVGADVSKHPFLRRWDHKGGDPNKGGLELAVNGALKLKRNEWLTLEDGVQIRFHEEPLETHQYRRGDYWLIPARTATGDVEWPRQEVTRSDGQKELVLLAVPPHGVEHHFAPLAIIPATGAAINTRRQFSLTVTEPTTATFAAPVEVSAESEAGTQKTRQKKGPKNNGNEK